MVLVLTFLKVAGIYIDVLPLAKDPIIALHCSRWIISYRPNNIVVVNKISNNVYV